MAKTTTYAETVFTANDSGFQRVAGRVDSGAKKLAKTFGKLAAVTVAGTGVFAAFVKTQLSVAESLSDTATKANASITALQKLRFAADQNGASARDMDDALTRLTRRMSLYAQDGAGPAAKAIKELGINVLDSNGDLRESTSVFDEIIAKFGAMESSAKKAALASQLFGEDAGPRLLPLINQGSIAIDEMGRKAERLGVVLGETGVRKAAALNAELRSLGQGIKTQFTAAIVDNIDEIKRLADVFTSLIPVAVSVATKIANIGASVAELAIATGRFLWLIEEEGTTTPASPVRVVVGAKPLEAEGEDPSTTGTRYITPSGLVADYGVDVADAYNLVASGGRGGAPVGDTPEARYQQAVNRFNDRNARKGASAGGSSSGGGGALSPTNAEIEALRERLATVAELQELQIEQAGEFYDSQLLALTEARDREIITEQEFYDLKERLAQEHEGRVKNIRGSSFNSQLGEAGKFFGAMATATANGGERLAKISKSFAAAEALVNAYRAASQTLADPKLSFFQKFAAATSVLAAGMGFVSAIKGGGGAGGAGSVPAQSTAGSVPQSDAGGGQVVNVNMTGERFGRSEVVAMFEALNEAIEDGAIIKGIAAT